MSGLLEIARGALSRIEAPNDINDQYDQSPPIAIAADPYESIRRGLLTGDLTGWHLERNADGETVEVTGLAGWHADVLGVTQ